MPERHGVALKMDSIAVDLYKGNMVWETDMLYSVKSQNAECKCE